VIGIAAWSIVEQLSSADAQGPGDARAHGSGTGPAHPNEPRRQDCGHAAGALPAPAQHP
jgi:hypothetical protein